MVKPNKLKTLIVVPDQNIENRRGGVHNFYKKLENSLEENHKYYYLNNDNLRIKNKLYTTLIHVYRIAKCLKVGRYDHLMLNTSLNINAILRDSLCALVGQLLNVRVIVFWRGWNFNNIKYLKFPYLLLTFPLLKVKKAIVLYSEISKSLRKLGYKNRIYNLTTMVDDDVFNHRIKFKEGEFFDILFLSRIETYKGIYELIDAYSILKQKYPFFKLSIAGNGKELNDLIEKVKELNLEDVEFVGYVEGDSKCKLLASCDLFVFPSYSEGMPNAVLEAMAVGLPIVTTRVGGLNDFFINEKMGMFVEMKSVKSLVDKIEILYLNMSLRKEISELNIEYSANNFTKSIVYSRLKEIILDED
ncbi:glycosyltransferase [Psychroserpens sp. MEBiC05023]